MTEFKMERIDGKWYVYGYNPDKCQCISVGPGNPPGGGRYIANGETPGAIKYVGRQYKTADSAHRAIRRLISGR